MPYGVRFGPPSFILMLNWWCLLYFYICIYYLCWKAFKPSGSCAQTISTTGCC